KEKSEGRKESRGWCDVTEEPAVDESQVTCSESQLAGGEPGAHTNDQEALPSPDEI
ncbi:Hypothetical predicted protein, partial [Marmota monax]